MLSVSGVAASVAAVDCLVRVQEEDIPGEVEIEFEATEVYSGDLEQTDANKLVRDISDVLVKTNNLLVNGGAVASRLAAEDHHHRFAGALGLFLAGGVVGIPAVPAGVGLRLGQRGTRDSAKCGQNQEAVHGVGFPMGNGGGMQRGAGGAARLSVATHLSFFSSVFFRTSNLTMAGP